jgi:hypothetical protein
MAFIACLACATFAVHAQAQGGPLSSLSSDAVFAGVGALLLAMLTGYTKGVDRRVTAVELQQRQVETQMVLFRETVLERHPSRAEIAQMREDVMDRFDELRALIREKR